MATLTSFPPIAGKDARILILGSMPGTKSLAENQYYAHPRNAFWSIMSQMYQFDKELSYQARCAELIANHVSLWDVLKHCERDGSLDSAIIENSIVANDFHQFFAIHSEIKLIGFNGGKAKQAFHRYVFPELELPKSCKLVRLPSTSPAYAALKPEKKLNIWSNLLSIVNKV